MDYKILFGTQLESPNVCNIALNHLWAYDYVHTMIMKTNPSINVSYGVIQHKEARAMDLIRGVSMDWSITAYRHLFVLQTAMLLHTLLDVCEM